MMRGIAVIGGFRTGCPAAGRWVVSLAVVALLGACGGGAGSRLTQPTPSRWSNSVSAGGSLYARSKFGPVQSLTLSGPLTEPAITRPEVTGGIKPRRTTLKVQA